MDYHHHHFSSSSGVDYRARQLEERRRVVEFFKEKGALDSAHAIKVGAVDWASLGVNPKMTGFLTGGGQFRFIVQTTDENYYLDETILTDVLTKEAELSKNTIKLVGGLFASFGIIWVIAAIIIGIAFLFIAYRVITSFMAYPF